MKTRTLNILFAILLFVAFSACDKVPVNGKLEGMWQVMSIEHNGTVTSLKEQKVYWSFQLQLAQFSSSLNGYTQMYSHFKHEGNELDFYDFCYNSQNYTESDNNEWVTPDNASVMNRWGIYPAEDSNTPGRVAIKYTISTLDDDNLIVVSERDTVQLRKF